MREMRITQILIPLLIPLLLSSCDTRYWGSRLTGEQLTETVQTVSFPCKRESRNDHTTRIRVWIPNQVGNDKVR